MSGQAKGDKYCNHVNIYLSKQNVNILFYSLYQGLFSSVNVNQSFIPFELQTSSEPRCIALSTPDFNLIVLRKKNPTSVT